MSIMKFAPEALKNLFKPPVTTKYPFVPFEYPERARGHIDIEIDQCIGCGMCVRACPSSALSVNKNEGTWTINRFDCIVCGYCVEKCPKKCLSAVPGYQEPEGEKGEATYQKSPEVLAEEKRKREEAAKKAAELKAQKANEQLANEGNKAK
ncbi:MAG: 4Fe-4S dicluster domain-containing protein [Lachnospiraceae bacterium]|nr:4Fe-4S dicluster domain-containing protein [Lachnospiraceae bacterium]